MTRVLTQEEIDEMLTPVDTNIKLKKTKVLSQEEINKMLVDIKNEDYLINEIKRVFKIKRKEIKNWEKLEGSNYVYSFIVKNKKYVVRKFTENNIMDWRQEKAVYEILKSLNITDELISYENGIKISVFFDNSNTLSFSEKDQIEALELLRKVHESGVSINYNYDIARNMEKYISKCDPKLKELKDLISYRNTIDKIARILDKLNIPKVLCHGDACVSANFLRLPDGSIKIIDWEQAGMADPFLDIAIASLHQGVSNADPVSSLHYYLGRLPDKTEYLRLYSYLALDSFSLMVWCLSCNNTEDYYEYKQQYAERYSGMVLKYYGDSE